MKVPILIESDIVHEVYQEDANLLIENGALKVFIFATHAIFAKYADKILQESKIERVVVSDTVEIPKYKLFPKLE